MDELTSQVPNVAPVLEEKLLGANTEFLISTWKCPSSMGHQKQVGYIGYIAPFVWLVFNLGHVFDQHQLDPPRFLERLRRGDPGLEMELGSACSAKDDKWGPRDNGCDVASISTTYFNAFPSEILLYLSTIG